MCQFTRVWDNFPRRRDESKDGDHSENRPFNHAHEQLYKFISQLNQCRVCYDAMFQFLGL
jgi:hypothetical protein